jgi:hypothetical protein
MMGSAPRPRARPSSGWCNRGEKVGLLKVRLFRPFDFAAFAPRCRVGEAHRGARPHQGARRPGEPLYQDVVTALAELAFPSARSSGEAAPWSAGATACPRRSSRPAMVRAVFDELASPRREPLHRRHQRRRDAHLAAVRRRLRSRARRRWCARVLRPGQPTARWSQQQEQHQDHRRGDRAARRRATSCTTRRSRAR